MELLIPEILGPEAQAQISRPEQKKELAKDLKQFLAIAQIAEREGFANRPEVQAQIDLLTDDVLARAYTKKHPEHKITEDEINAYVDANGSQIEAYLAADPKAKQIEGAQLDSFKRAFAQSKIGSQLARKEGLDEDKTNELMTMFTRSRVLYGAYMNSLIEKYHEEHKNEYEQVRARHILISTSPQDEAPPTGAGQDKEGADKQPKALSKEEARKKAESILARVRKGEDFAKLASEFNPDATKETGGDLDYFSRGRMLPEFEQAAFALKPGEVSDLVETQYGFHIIKVEDRRLAPVDDPMTQQQILAKLQPELDKLAESSNIKVAEDFNFTPKAAPPRRGMPGGVPNPHGGPPPQ
jgi:parvulin-like peptidyl-prolyl isomerase